ncbi:ankyrin [Aspergillus sclerotiicarbonarius CBS 121057]|uniref:Ankyrin n=1 Tax=Aspergillus sclerotiicarbonarius (strain CBS 121057 / IBT 28362) TaxID=1448318 RepID=A0A319EG37_ASPSB|nr:ankyrin [Aspergillus sclerotiicarbonarius CBS 121057]
MSLTSLPPELLLLIAGTFLSEKDLNAVSRTTRVLYGSLNPLLYRRHVQQSHGRTALLYAAQTGQTETIHHLRAAEDHLGTLTTDPEANENDDLPTLDRDGRDPQFKLPPLAWAAIHGHVRVAELLLDMGALVDLDTIMNRTALSHAAENGHVEVVRLLLRHGASPHSQDRVVARTPLMWAGSPRLPVTTVPVSLAPSPSGLGERLPSLANGKLVHRAKRSTEQQHVGRQICASCIKIYRDDGVEKLFFPGRTPWSAGAAYEDILDLLLEYGADLETISRVDGTALTLAAKCGYEPIVRVLPARGASVSPSSPHASPVLGAVSGEHVELMRLLLDRGAAVGTLAELKFNPLAEAVGKGNGTIVRLLLDAIKESELEDYPHPGWAPLSRAATIGNIRIMELLLDAHARLWPTILIDLADLLFSAARSAREGMVAFLLEAGAPVNQRSVYPHMFADGQSPIHAAAIRHPGIMRQLLARRDLNINAQDRYGYTALTWASRAYNGEVAQLLLEHGADPAFTYVPGPRFSTPTRYVCGNFSMGPPPHREWLISFRPVELWSIK